MAFELAAVVVGQEDELPDLRLRDRRVVAQLSELAARGHRDGHALQPDINGGGERCPDDYVRVWIAAADEQRAGHDLAKAEIGGAAGAPRERRLVWAMG